MVSPEVFSSGELFLPLPPISAVVFRQAEGLAHGGGGHVLGGGVQMGVDIHGGADVAVAQPLLDQLQIDAVLQQQRGAAMPEIVETDMPQSFHFQQLAEIAAQVTAPPPYTHRLWFPFAYMIIQRCPGVQCAIIIFAVLTIGYIFFAAY